MEGDFIKINHWLRPLSWLYGLGVSIRNTLFDIGLLKSKTFDMPVIAVGNITVGGTGKTPHVEYLISLLDKKVNVAVLSRGYKRKTSGFVLAGAKDNARTIGDEPFQMKQKFKRLTVAVDKDRCHGIEMLEERVKDVDVILLDDAFQHRYVKPGINILLVDYHRLIIYDTLLPAGRMREPLSGKNRADIVIITKCPNEMKPMEFRVLTKQMDLFPYQQLFFTTLTYAPLQALFRVKSLPLDTITQQTHLLLVTGIASPKQMVIDLQPHTKHIHLMAFGDHHAFTPDDIERINNEFAELPKPRLVITTEKDAARLSDVEGLDDDVKQNIYSLPVKIKFLLDQEGIFNDDIIGYVLKNSKNSTLTKAKETAGTVHSNHRSKRRNKASNKRNNL